MSIIRMRLHSAALLGVLAVGIPVLGSLLATPAAALCLGGGCGFRFHGGAASRMFVRRQTAPSFAMPANQAARMHFRQHVSSAGTFSSNSAVPRSVRSRSLASATSGSTSTGPKSPVSDFCKKHHTCISIPHTANDITPGGPSTAATQAPSFSQGGPAAGGNALPGGGALGGGNASAGISGPGTSRGNGPSGLAAVPPSSSGAGPGQFTTSGGPVNDSPGARRSLDPGSNRPSTGGASATKQTETTQNTTTQNTTKANTTAPDTKTTALTAVTVCMTRAGSCPMERDIGTACQCKDAQGNRYDGIVK